MSSISATAIDPTTLSFAPDKKAAQGPVSARDLSQHLAATSGQTVKPKDVGEQFEAMYLRQMLDAMMPKDSENLFGDGTAGPMWRSMMVDSLATALSKTGSIGIAHMIVKPHAADGKG
jgi:peptidoglycan hydrolase FlgJ